MEIASLTDEQGKQELRAQFVELRAMGNRQACQEDSQMPLFSRLKGYRKEAFVAGPEHYASGLAKWTEKIGLSNRDAVIIQNPSSYQVDERGYCQDLVEESDHDPYQ